MLFETAIPPTITTPISDITFNVVSDNHSVPPAVDRPYAPSRKTDEPTITFLPLHLCRQSSSSANSSAVFSVSMNSLILMGLVR